MAPVVSPQSLAAGQAEWPQRASSHPEEPWGQCRPRCRGAPLAAFRCPRTRGPEADRRPRRSASCPRPRGRRSRRISRISWSRCPLRAPRRDSFSRKCRSQCTSPRRGTRARYRHPFPRRLGAIGHAGRHCTVVAGHGHVVGPARRLKGTVTVVFPIATLVVEHAAESVVGGQVVVVFAGHLAGAAAGAAGACRNRIRTESSSYLP